MFLKIALLLILTISIYSQSTPIKSVANIDSSIQNNLNDYIGDYKLPDFSIKVSSENGNLILAPSIQGVKKFPIYPKTANQFFTKINDAIISFERDQTGKVKYLIWEQGGHTYKGIKTN